MKSKFVTVLAVMVFLGLIMAYGALPLPRWAWAQTEAEAEAEEFEAPETQDSGMEMEALDYVEISGLQAADINRLQTLDGKRFDLAGYQGRVLVLNLWATWCAPCVAELPSLAELQEKMAQEGVVVLAVTLDRAENGDISAFLDKHGAATLTPLRDPGRVIWGRAKVEGLPATLLIDGKGQVRGMVRGAADWTGDEAVALVRSVMDAGLAVKAGASASP